MKGFIHFDSDESTHFGFNVPCPYKDSPVVEFEVKEIVGWATRLAPEPGSLIGKTTFGENWEKVRNQEYKEMGIYLGRDLVLVPLTKEK
jgi:hypothetical protein